MNNNLDGAHNQNIAGAKCQPLSSSSSLSSSSTSNSTVGAAASGITIAATTSSIASAATFANLTPSTVATPIIIKSTSDSECTISKSSDRTSNPNISNFFRKLSGGLDATECSATVVPPVQQANAKISDSSGGASTDGAGSGGDLTGSSGGGGVDGVKTSQPFMPSGCFAHHRQSYCSASGAGDVSNLSEAELREIIFELTKKMEYTERMNWLCLSNRPVGPPHRKTSLPNHKEVKKRFLEICDQTLSEEVKAALRLPTFDSYEWSDESVLHLMQTMFIDCGFVEKFNIPLAVLREWLYEVYKHYNIVPFHNFRHCFCVAQMMYAMAWHTNLTSRLGDLEVLVLLVSCICHDLDHPGYNNIYQINARTELALRYNDISPLENHHCSIAFRLLENPDCNIFKNFSKETFREIREGIIRCILATDMARHNEILSQFQEILPHFDYSNQSHINIFCMVLIKVADISNESRPMDIAEPWLERLFQEFFAQSAIEKSEGLPVTPFMDPDKVSKPGSQVRFIGLVLLPLFETLGELLPELNDLIIHPVRVAFDYYKCLNDSQIKPRKSQIELDDSSDGGGGGGGGGTATGDGSATHMPRSQSGVSLRSRRSMPSQKSVSRTSVDEPMCISAELHDLPEGSESGDSETATEVEVAEKASKFIINSEGNHRNKCSRKESRRKRPSMISEMYTSSFGGRSRGSYGSIHGHHHAGRCHFGSSRALSLDQYNSRRLSDGVQAIVSDETTIFYNRQHRSLENEVTGSNMSEKYLSSDSCGGVGGGGGGGGGNGGSSCMGDVGTKTATVCCSSGGKQSQTLKTTQKNQVQTKNNNGAARSFMSTLRQLKETFNFSFEKDLKRHVAGPNIAATTNAKNNNPEFIRSSGFCCSVQKDESMMKPSATTRNRACSLDVPVRMWYNCNHSSAGNGGSVGGMVGSGGGGYGDSRKSSHNNEDNNSNHTISGDNNKSDADANRSDGTSI